MSPQDFRDYEGHKGGKIPAGMLAQFQLIMISVSAYVDRNLAMRSYTKMLSPLICAFFELLLAPPGFQSGFADYQLTKRKYLYGSDCAEKEETKKLCQEVTTGSGDLNVYALVFYMVLFLCDS